ncbi:MAG TPA: hypothetical protein VKR06_43410 [Ktedonosporobacter sp.]|nr:hypothetical protein [Ktedonosporobacter sp.]
MGDQHKGEIRQTARPDDEIPAWAIPVVVSYERVVKGRRKVEICTIKVVMECGQPENRSLADGIKRGE